MAERHPREETDKERQLAHRRLRQSCQGKLNRHGQLVPHPIPFYLSARVVPLRLKDGRPCTIVELTPTVDSPRTPHVLKVNLFSTEDLMGPRTCYGSKNEQPFTRTDLDPKESGAPDSEDITMNLESILHPGVLAAVFSKQADIAEGLDGLIISAQEAKEVGLTVRTSSIRYG